MENNGELAVRKIRLFGVDIQVTDHEPPRRVIKRPRLTPPGYQHLPDAYKEFIATKGGDVDGSLRLVFGRTLTDTDMHKHHARLSIPRHQIKHQFLTPEEEEAVRQKRLLGNRMRCCNIPVAVVDPALGLRSMSLARWNDSADGDNNERKRKSWWYALTNNWTKLVEDNKLSAGDAIQVWSFRFEPGGQLGLVIHKLDK